MNDLESKIIEILKRGTPLRAIQIANMLKVERREVNHYLYSSLKHMVVQDSDNKWSLKTNQISNTQRPSSQAPSSHTKSSEPVRQNNLYSFTKQDIKQDSPLRPQTSQTQPSQPVKSTSQTQPSQPVKQTNPYEVIKRELAQASPEEKVKIIDNAFRQEQFIKLEDDDINALQSILEQAKREVNIANTAYTQGKLSIWKTNPIVIAALSIALTLGTLFFISQFLPKSTDQPTRTIPQNQSMGND